MCVCVCVSVCVHKEKYVYIKGRETLQDREGEREREKHIKESISSVRTFIRFLPSHFQPIMMLEKKTINFREILGNMMTVYYFGLGTWLWTLSLMKFSIFEKENYPPPVIYAMNKSILKYCLLDVRYY